MQERPSAGSRLPAFSYGSVDQNLQEQNLSFIDGLSWSSQGTRKLG